MTRTTVGMQAAARAAGPSGPLDGGGGALVLSGDELTERLQFLFALVDADGPAVDSVGNRLRAAFRPGGEIDDTVPGMEEFFLTSVLHRLDGEVADVPIVLAVRRDDELVLRTRGGTCAYAGQARVVADLLRRMPEEGEDEQAVPPLPVAPDDFLVLAGAEVAHFVREEEVVQALTDCPTVDDAAGSIAGLAARRGGRIARTAVIRLGDTPAPKAAPPEREKETRTAPAVSRRPRSRSLLVALAALLAVLVAAGVAAYDRLHGGSRTANPQPAAPAAAGPAAPGGLVAVQDAPWRVRLSWRLVPRAVGYTIHVGRHRYQTTAASVALAGILRPGRNYRWSVSAGFPGGRTMTSPRIPLRLLPQPNPYWRFPPLAHASSPAVLSVANRGPRPATVTVVAASGGRRVLATPVVDPGRHLDLLISTLPGASPGVALDVIATAPIVATRSAKIGSATTSDYGFPEQFMSATGTSPSAAATPGPRTATLTATVRVHSAPAITAPIVRVAPAGTRVQVLGSRGNWIDVRLPGGATGYVLGTYVK